MYINNNYKKIVYFIGFIILLVIVFNITLSISRIGKTKVVIEVAPNDSRITIDNKQANIGDNYLKPGKYNVKAEKQGFSTDEEVVDVNRSSIVVYLTPNAVSDEAKQWYKDNPNEQLKREGIAGKKTDQESEGVVANNQIIELLPVTEIDSGPFSIDYGTKVNNNKKVFIEISDSSPEGRVNALHWIRSHGFDPSDLDIKFDDFVNPLINSDNITNNGGG